MTHYIVRARSDGRAGMPMFGLPTKQAKSFAGQTVHIGDRELTVGRDGRINIPKDIMNEYGVKGADGRQRLSINFASDSKGNLGVLAYAPPHHQKDAQTGDVTRPYKGLDVEDDEVILEPSDAPDFNWSPL